MTPILLLLNPPISLPAGTLFGLAACLAGALVLSISVVILSSGKE